MEEDEDATGTVLVVDDDLAITKVIDGRIVNIGSL